MVNQSNKVQLGNSQEPRAKLRRKPNYSVGKKNTSTTYKKYISLVLIFSAVLPLISWIIGASINPDGWMSGSPEIIPGIIYVYATQFWFVPLAIIFIVAGVLTYLNMPPSFKAKLWTGVIFLISLSYSILIFTLVKDADKTEFSG